MLVAFPPIHQGLEFATVCLFCVFVNFHCCSFEAWDWTQPNWQLQSQDCIDFITGYLFMSKYINLGENKPCLRLS